MQRIRPLPYSPKITTLLTRKSSILTDIPARDGARRRTDTPSTNPWDSFLAPSYSILHQGGDVIVELFNVQATC
jgi:hypothetical protein